MARTPRNLVEKVQFFETHIAKFAEDPESIGLTAEFVDELRADAEAARAAYAEQQQLMQAARAATLKFNSAVKRLNRRGQAAIKMIRGEAGRTGDANVYSRSGITPIAKWSRQGPPCMPSDLKTSIDSVGALHLKWSMKHPGGGQGSTYEVRRRFGYDEPFVRIATALSSKSFVDRTIPKGATEVHYEISASRSSGFGQPARFTVQFGTNGEMPLPVMEIGPDARAA